MRKLRHEGNVQRSLLCLNTVPTILRSVFGLAMLVPGNVTGADPGTLQHSSGLKFRLGPDCSRLEKRLAENVCVPHVWHCRHPLLSQIWLKRQVHWLQMTPNLHVLLILMFFHLDGSDRRLLSRPGRHMRPELNFPKCNVTTTSQTPLSCLSNINALLSFVSTQLFIKYWISWNAMWFMKQLNSK